MIDICGTVHSSSHKQTEHPFWTIHGISKHFRQLEKLGHAARAALEGVVCLCLRDNIDEASTTCISYAIR